MAVKLDLSNRLIRPPVGNEVYDAEYFSCHAGGATVFEKFMETGAAETYPIYFRIIEALKPSLDERVLDIGCGRGEVVALFAMKGLRAFGLDFSCAALQMASRVRDVFAGNHGALFHFIRAEATALPFPARYFDHIVLSDIVEHLHNWQLTKLYAECWRVLRPLGKIIVHSWPNLWHTKYTYPVVARFSRLLGIQRPLNHCRPHDEIMHVNEQSLRSLRHGLQKANFEICRSWCEHDVPFAGNLGSILYWLSHRTPGLRLLFADHLWALAIKNGS